MFLPGSFLEIEGFWTFVFGKVGFFIACIIFDILTVKVVFEIRDFRGKRFLYESVIVVLLSVVANTAHYYHIRDAYEMMLNMINA